MERPGKSHPLMAAICLLTAGCYPDFPSDWSGAPGPPPDAFIGEPRPEALHDRGRGSEGESLDGGSPAVDRGLAGAGDSHLPTALDRGLAGAGDSHLPAALDRGLVRRVDAHAEPLADAQLDDSSARDVGRVEAGGVDAGGVDAGGVDPGDVDAVFPGDMGLDRDVFDGFVVDAQIDGGHPGDVGLDHGVFDGFVIDAHVDSSLSDDLGAYAPPDSGADAAGDASPDAETIDAALDMSPCVPGPDRCDLIDDDCDGLIDEGPLDADECVVDDNGCALPGALMCVDGAVVCQPIIPPEVCDVIDNDCDGAVDELLPVDACRPPLLAISDGASPHACLVGPDGLARCSGDAAHGRLDAPVAPLAAIAAGENFTCGLLRDGGSVSCWGNDSHGQVSDAPAGSFRQLAAGGRTACAVAADRVVCWGRNLDGQAEPPPSTFVEIAMASDFACGLRDAPLGGVECWGRLPAVIADAEAVLAAAGDAWSLAVGDSHVCILESERGNMRCWGAGAFHGPTFGEGFAAAVTGQRFTCAHGAEQQVMCWGFVVALPDQPLLIAAGASVLCGVYPGLELRCWPNDDLFSPPE